MIKIFKFFVFFYFMNINLCFAYIDPGPVASFWATIVSFIFSILIFVKLKWMELKNHFIKFINKKNKNDKK